MPSLNVSRETKREFDKLQPDELTQSEFVSELLSAYKRDNGEVVDVNQIVEQITKQTASQVELAAYRGTTDALESHD